MSYQEHGLTFEEDSVLGAFGEDNLSDSMTLDMYPVGAFVEAFKSLTRKGLLESHIRDDEVIEYRLTPKGKKLWKVRAKEEEQGPR